MSATPLASQSAPSSSSRSPTRHHSNTNVSPNSPSSRQNHSNHHRTIHTSSTPNLNLPPTSSVSRQRTNRSHQEALLPAGAIVRITGNNRTKQELVGRTGQVVLATMLGGWHQVRLSDNHKSSYSDEPIVRLQRNALEVVSLPDNQTPAPNIRFDHSSQKADPYISRTSKISRPTNTQNHPGPSSGAVTKPAKYNHSNRPSKNNSIPTHSNLSPQQNHKVRQSDKSSPNHRYQNDSKFDTQHSRSCIVIANLNSESLQRYRKTFNLKVPHDCSREELVNAASKHFEKISVNEPQVIADFIATISKRHRHPSSSLPSPHSELNN